MCSDIESIWQHGWRTGFYRSGPVLMSALSGIDIALWDLKGKSQRSQLYVVHVRVCFMLPSPNTFTSIPWLALSKAKVYTARKLGVPIYQLLGGKVRTALKVYAWIGGDRPADVEAQA